MRDGERGENRKYPEMFTQHEKKTGKIKDQRKRRNSVKRRKTDIPAAASKNSPIAITRVNKGQGREGRLLIAKD